MRAGATACIEDPLARPRVESLDCMTPIEGDEWIGRCIVGVRPAIVSLAHSRTFYSLAHSLALPNGYGAQLRACSGLGPSRKGCCLLG